MKRSILRVRGEVATLDAESRRALMDRSASVDGEVRLTVASIIERVRRCGDSALRELAAELDHVALTAIEVPRHACVAALDALPPRLRAALERAVHNLESVHRAFLPPDAVVQTEIGITVGRRADPLDRVGIYAPGGRASYPSSVLMGAVPARVAGVREVVLCSPPDASGLPPAAVLAAALLAGVDRVFAVGGAGAIAALAFGTESVPRVDLIAGPGNVFVAEAKLQVASRVAIDAPAGPSELLVIADEAADLRAVAREMLAQAEHDPRACVVALVIGSGRDVELVAELAGQLPGAPRRATIGESLAANGAVLRSGSLREAAGFATEYAPEHLLLAVRDPEALLPLVRNAGTVLLGIESSVVFGDYMTGANHVLPTAGLARAYDGLTTSDFMRWTTYQRVTRAAARAMATDVAYLAEIEQLDAHSRAAAAWEVPE